MKRGFQSSRIVRLSFASAILVLIAVGGVSYRSIVESNASNVWVEHTRDVLRNIRLMRLAMETVSSGLRGYIISGDEATLEGYRDAKLSIESNRKIVATMTEDNPVQQKRVAALKMLAEETIQLSDRVIELRRTAGLEAAIDAVRDRRGEQIIDEFQAIGEKMLEEETNFLAARSTDADQDLSQTKLILISGTLLGLLITGAAGWSVQRDIGARAAAELALRDSEEQYRMLVQAVQDYAIFMLDPHGRIVTWNAGAERIKGYSADEIIGQNYSRFFTPEDIRRGKPEESLRNAEATGRHEEQTMRVRKDGTRFVASVVVIALHDSAGKLSGFSKITRDLSETAESEARYRGLLEAAPDAMVVVNTEGTIVLLNAQAEKQFGYPRDELIGQKVTNIIPVGFAERLVADDLRSTEDALAQQIGTGIELVARRKDKSEFPIEIMLSPLESTEGILVTAAIRDISVRKAAESEMGQMEERYRGLLEAAPDAMVVVNTEGEIVLLNVQAEKQFGYRRDELIGQKVTNIIPVGFAERLVADDLRSTEEALAQQIGTGIELVARRKDKSEFPIEIMLSPLESTEGILVTAAVRDISVRKKMERLKSEFVSSVSHELRTPLTSISASLGLLVGKTAGDLPAPATHLIAIAHSNSQRLVRLVNDILDIEKLDAGKTVFNYERVDVRRPIELAIKANLGSADAVGVRIMCDIDAGAVVEVRADAERLAQALTNLLSNAVKFSPRDAEVEVAVASRGKEIRIAVRDHGDGIPEDFKPRLFERFAQADGTDTRLRGGTGLGLSIVKQIVDRLGGKVGFGDAPGGGALFYIDLPAWVEDADVATETEAQLEALKQIRREFDHDEPVSQRPPPRTEPAVPKRA